MENENLIYRRGAFMFWFAILSLIFVVFGFTVIVLAYLGIVSFPMEVGSFGINAPMFGFIFTYIGVFLVFINSQLRTERIVEREEKVMEDLIGHEKVQLFFEHIFVLFLLVLAAVVFVGINPDLFNSYDGLKSMTFLQRIIWSIWFGILGTVTISLKGLADYAMEKKKKFDKWFIWYLERPFNGFIVGVMTYVILQILNTDTMPSLPSLAGASFILGLREYKFYEILKKVSDMVLTTDKGEEGAKKKELD